MLVPRFGYTKPKNADVEYALQVTGQISQTNKKTRT